MMKFINILFVFVILFNIDADAQRWKRTRYEITYGIGYSATFGDFGGGAGDAGSIATSIKDFDIQGVRPAAALGARYKFTEAFAMKLNFTYGYLASADNYSKSTTRDRGLSFSTYLFEPSIRFELALVKEKLGRRYTLSNIRGLKNLHINTYIIAGVGYATFNPKLKYDGNIVEDINTIYWADKSEESLNPSNSSLVIPVGIGFKYGINRKLSLSIEYANRWTFTDYIDGYKDVNSKYNDTYMFMTFSLNYKLRTTRKGWPKF